MTTQYSDQLRLIGDLQESIPVLLIGSPILNPTEKVVWQALRITLPRSGSGGTMPTIDILAQTICISSRSVIDALKVLRLTRWLSLQKQFDEFGKQQANLYAIHTNQAKVNDIVSLDPEYISQLDECTQHKNSRISKIAKAILLEMKEYPDIVPSTIHSQIAQSDRQIENISSIWHHQPHATQQNEPSLEGEHSVSTLGVQNLHPP